MCRVPILLLSLVLIAPVLSSQQNEYEGVSGTAHGVYDGDTFRVGDTRTRLWGIDTPEANQLCERNSSCYPCGEQASSPSPRGVA